MGWMNSPEVNSNSIFAISLINPNVSNPSKSFFESIFSFIDKVKTTDVIDETVDAIREADDFAGMFGAAIDTINTNFVYEDECFNSDEYNYSSIQEVVKSYANNIYNISVNSIEQTSQNYNEIGALEGYSVVNTSTNSSNQVTKETKQVLDVNGEYQGEVSTEYIYDDNGKLVQQIKTGFDKNGKKISSITETFDDKGNIIAQKGEKVEQDGSIETIESVYHYALSGKYPNTCTGIVEKRSYCDKNGKIIYKSSNTTNLIDTLKEMYPDDIKNPRTLDAALSMCKRKGLDISSETIHKGLKEVLLNTDGVISELSNEMIKSVETELNSKLDLMTTSNREKEKLKKELNSAISSKDCDAIKDIYNKINKKLYPEGSHFGFTREIVEINAAKKYLGEKTKQEIKDDYAIRSDFDAKTMTPQNYGEILLSQMQELKDQWEIQKENMGSFDKLVSFLNIFNLGTSEKEVKKMFELYEKEVKSLSNMSGDKFLAKFKTLTGDDFSQETQEEMWAAQFLCEGVKNLNNDELMDKAKDLEVDINNAYEIDYSKPHISDTGVVTYPEKKLNYDKLRTLVKAEYLQGITADNSILGKAVDDHISDVEKHRNFIVDFARIAASAAACASGAGIIACGCIEAGVELFADLLNSDATGDQQIKLEETVNSMASAFFSAGARNVLNKCLIGKGVTKELLGDYLYIWIDKVAISGIGANTIKNVVNFALDNKNEIAKLINGELNEKEFEYLRDEFCDNLASGVLNGAVTGVLLALFECANIQYGSKLKQCVLEKLSNGANAAANKIIKGDIDKTYEKIASYVAKTTNLMAKTAKATGKTIAKTTSSLIQGNNVSLDEIMETEFFEITKAAMKR